MMTMKSASDDGAIGPLVSVIIPCFRQAKYLPEAVHSVIEQKYQNWECIIVNDGSPDATRSVAAALVNLDSRIRYVEQPNRGAASARNRGLGEAKGKFVQFLDADDLLLPESLSSGTSAAQSAEGLAIVISNYSFVDEAGRRFENHMCSPTFQFDTPLYDIALRWETDLSVPPNAMLFDARFFRDHGIRFSEVLPNHEDWDCWMRICRLNPKICRVEREHSIYRVHSQSVTRSGDDKNWQGFRRAIDLQLSLSVGQTTLHRMLLYKRMLTDDFYGKSYRAWVLTRLRSSRWPRKCIPAALREWLSRRLDLSNLRAHGWL